jgi:hypothetical protein
MRRALVRFGGMERWADGFDLPVGTFRGPHPAWTEERIEASVRALIGDRVEWPRRREFNAAGLGGCYAAISRTGGRFGVGRPSRCRRCYRARRSPSQYYGVPDNSLAAFERPIDWFAPGRRPSRTSRTIC